MLCQPYFSDRLLAHAKLAAPVGMSQGWVDGFNTCPARFVGFLP